MPAHLAVPLWQQQTQGWVQMETLHNLSQCLLHEARAEATRAIPGGYSSLCGC